MYPTISNLWNRQFNARQINEYQEKVTDITDEEKEAIWDEALEYNRHHTENVVHDFYEEKDAYKISHPYDTMLDPGGTHIMGSIEIPKINVHIAVHHGISAKVLDVGAGHIEGTSLPTGGKGTHAVLSAHRGLPSAKLFTDLDQIVVGDQFYLHIMDKHLAYEVDQIKTVLPEVTEDLAIDKKKDYVTLITCTPYGVNTHRLLVRGHRVKYVPPEEDDSIFAGLSMLQLSLILLGLGLLSFLIVFLIMRRRDKKRREAAKKKKVARLAAGASLFPEDCSSPLDRVMEDIQTKTNKNSNSQ